VRKASEDKEAANGMAGITESDSLMVNNVVDLIRKICDCVDGRAVVMSNLLTPYYEQFNTVKKLIMKLYLDDSTDKSANTISY